VSPVVVAGCGQTGRVPIDLSLRYVPVNLLRTFRNEKRVNWV
ncbi:hypothetical protein JMJ77_0012932, partial [Colletotrichum scovillei]